MYPPEEPQPPANGDVSDAEYTPYVPRQRAAKQERTPYRSESADPLFGLLIAIALSIGLTPLLPQQADLRYTLVWAAMAGFGVLAWLLGSGTRIAQEKPENLVWGVVFGLILGAPLLLLGSSALASTVRRLFADMSVGTLLAYVVFVMPLAETLFLRGVLQEKRRFWMAALLSSVWSGVLYLPLLDVGRFPGPALVIGVTLLMMNVMYSYVRQRNGLAAAWLCQITANLVLLALPFLGG
ncbi:MAG: CPBP family intramembrane metalloprotease [Chloroflexi bacterium]|nr:CPBP family intramembrane metalloprotease [Chloroflexota bacterium]